MKDYKKDFPLLKSSKIIYLDSAATSQKPKTVIEAVSNWYSKKNSNVHRGAYKLAETATLEFEQARETVAKFINAEPKNIVFIKGATEGINLVASAWAKHNLKTGDTILLTEMEHHANIVPWQLLAEEKKIKLRYWPIDKTGQLTRPTPKLFIGVKLLAMAHVSNVLGTINPIEKIIKQAKTKNIPVLIDAAQSAPHLPIDIKALDPDWLVFSSHKMLGPTGIGVLYVKQNRYQEMRPYQGGGEMIKKVSWQKTTFKPGPWQFEAGTQALAQISGLIAAIKYLKKIGLKTIQQHETQLLNYAYNKLQTIPEVLIFGPDPKNRSGLISFSVKGIHPHDLATWLDQYHIAIRAGHHCAEPLHQKLGVVATARISFYLYNTKKDVDSFVKALKEIIKSWQNSTKK